MRPFLVAALLFFGNLLSSASQAERLGTGVPPHYAEIKITEPVVDRVVRLGETLRVSWKLSGKFLHPKNWDLLVFLQECAISRVPLYQGPLTKAPNHLNWVFTASNVSPPIERGEATAMKVWVCVYNRHEGNEELLAMSLGCKAALAVDVFACETSSSSIELKP